MWATGEREGEGERQLLRQDHLSPCARLTCYYDCDREHDADSISHLSQEQTDHSAAEQQEDQGLLDLVYELGQGAWRLAGCELIVAPYCLAMSQRCPGEAIANEGDGCGC